MQVTGVQGPIMLTTTLMIVVITVVVFGGSTTVMLERLKIATHVHEEDEGDDLLNVGAQAERPNWFVKFERNYIKKFFRMAVPPSRMTDEAMRAAAGGVHGGGLSGRAVDHDNGHDDDDPTSPGTTVQMVAVSKVSLGAGASGDLDLGASDDDDLAGMAR